MRFLNDYTQYVSKSALVRHWPSIRKIIMWCVKKKQFMFMLADIWSIIYSFTYHPCIMLH